MIVQKFGGTSVADPEAINRLISIVRDTRGREGRGHREIERPQLIVDDRDNQTRLCQGDRNNYENSCWQYIFVCRQRKNRGDEREPTNEQSLLDKNRQGPSTQTWLRTAVCWQYLDDTDETVSIRLRSNRSHDRR